MPWREHRVLSVALPSVVQQVYSDDCPVFRASPLHIFQGTPLLPARRFVRFPVYLCGVKALRRFGMPYAKGQA
jgi:hypothetical protein